jgi:sulfotransferase family protein
MNNNCLNEKITSLSLDKKFIFILGAPRSGTTWLHRIMSEHEQVASTPGVELTFFTNYLPPLVERWQTEQNNLENKGWTKGLPYLWSQNEFNEFINDFFSKVYGKLIEKKENTTHIVDKNPAYSNQVNLIHHCLPDAKFIHIVRDGRDVAVSMISARKRMGFGPDNIFDASRFWKKSIINSQKAKNLGKDNYLEIKYEELLKNEFEYLKQIFFFCGLKTDDDFLKTIINKYNYRSNPVSSPNPEAKKIRGQKKVVWKDKLRPIEKYIFYKISGRLLHQLNYSADNERWWYENTFQRFILTIAYPFFSISYYSGKLIKIIQQKLFYF